MILCCAILIPLLLYGAAIAALTAALLRNNSRKDYILNDNPPGVSIIIPFRNEEENLPALLASLNAQNYSGAAEVIFVNDGSEDNGAGVIKGHIQNNGRVSVKIVDLQLSGGVRLTSKQQALDFGVAQSSHPLLLFTDADMVLAPNWVESLVKTHTESGAELVFGHTSISRDGKNSRLFTALEAYQLEFLFAFAYAFSKLNLTGSCMGNNLLVVKDTYIRCGGQRGAGYSIVEDRALLELLRKRGVKTAAAEPFRVTAATRPSRAWGQFFNQTARWARGGLRPGSGLFWAGFLLLVQNAAAFAVFLQIISGTVSLLTDYNTIPQAMFPMFTTHLPPLTAAAPAIINFLLTWAFLTLAFGKTRSPAPRLLYPVYYLFMMAETVIFAFSLAFGREIEWKGRKLRGGVK